VVVGGSSAYHHFLLIPNWLSVDVISGGANLTGEIAHRGITLVSRVHFALTKFLRDESAQGITEYGAILAFVSILVAITFGLTNGSLMPAISLAFSAVSEQLNSMAATASAASGS